MMPSRVSAFDELAADYDREELANPLRRLMRARSLSVLPSAFPAGANLLEVGCGTGTEAIWMSQQGHRVTAVDSSPRMLEILSARAEAAKVKITTRLLSAGKLATLVDEVGEAAFDGAYSSFGALNTEPSIDVPLAALAKIVRPGGRMVLSVMNRWCVSEMALMVASGRPNQALRRLRPSLPVRVGSALMDVRYPSWRQLRRALNQDFHVVSVEALLLVLLPSAWPALASHDGIYKMLARLDGMLSSHRPWSLLGDHLLVVAERRQ